MRAMVRRYGYKWVWGLLAALLALAALASCRAETTPPVETPYVFEVTASRPEPPGALVISSEDGPPFTTPEQNGIIDRVLQEAFRRIGQPITIVYVPAERALQNVNAGVDDGNFLRIAGLASQYPNLVQVPEKLTDYNFVAFTRQVEGPLSHGWSDLQPYDVGLITGWKIVEANVGGAHSVIRVRDQYQLFALLDTDRADLVIYSRQGGQALIEELGLTGIHSLEPPLASREMFLYLHKKHAALVPRLAAALREMKRDGSYDRLVQPDQQP